jgi:hypothetical protein
MESIAIHGLSPRPDVLHRMAREKAAAASIEQALAEHRARARLAHRADTSTRCPSCDSSIYDGAYGYCPSCGFERTRNGHPVLDHPGGR